MNDQELHAHLIGRQGSRRDLNTPVLVLDLDRLDRNIASMAAFAASHGLKLRPHAKTHKSVDIARRQIAALQRKVGEQQLALDFFEQALRRIEASRQPNDGPGETASSPRSKR